MYNHNCIKGRTETTRIWNERKIGRVERKENKAGGGRKRKLWNDVNNGMKEIKEWKEIMKGRKRRKGRKRKIE